jgi:hypothetical protein
MAGRGGGPGGTVAGRGGRESSRLRWTGKIDTDRLREIIRLAVEETRLFEAKGLAIHKGIYQNICRDIAASGQAV